MEETSVDNGIDSGYDTNIEEVPGDLTYRRGYVRLRSKLGETTEVTSENLKQQQFIG